MDDHRFDDALTDAALDRDLEAALAVDPPPALVARVRMRVQRERDASWSPLPWAVAAAAGAIVVVAAAVVGMSRVDRSQMARDSSAARPTSPVPITPDLNTAPQPVHVATPNAPGTPEVAVAQDFSPARRRAPSTRRSAPRNEPEVIFAADEARALRQLFSDVRNGLIDLSSLREVAPANAALQPPSDIAFPPITFESIAPQTAEEGERQ
jgi:hypothetical protein